MDSVSRLLVGRAAVEELWGDPVWWDKHDYLFSGSSGAGHGLTGLAALLRCTAADAADVMLHDLTAFFEVLLCDLVPTNAPGSRHCLAALLLPLLAQGVEPACQLRALRMVQDLSQLLSHDVSADSLMHSSVAATAALDGGGGSPLRSPARRGGGYAAMNSPFALSPRNTPRTRPGMGRLGLGGGGGGGGGRARGAARWTAKSRRHARNHGLVNGVIFNALHAAVSWLAMTSARDMHLNWSPSSPSSSSASSSSVQSARVCTLVTLSSTTLQALVDGVPLRSLMAGATASALNSAQSGASLLASVATAGGGRHRSSATSTGDFAGDFASDAADGASAMVGPSTVWALLPAAAAMARMLVTTQHVVGGVAADITATDDGSVGSEGGLAARQAAARCLWTVVMQCREADWRRLRRLLRYTGPGRGTLLDAPLSPGRLVAIRKHLEEVYAAHNPSKLDDIDTILRSFVGREEIMFHKLYAKYDITTPIPTSCTALVGGGEDTAMDGLDDTTHIRRSETLWLKTCVYLLGPAGQRDVVLASAASSPLSVSGDEAASVSAGPRTPAGPFGGGGGGDAALAEPWFQPFSRRALSSPTSPSLVVALASLLCMASETLVDVEQRALAGIGDDDDDDDDSSDDSGGDLGGGGSMGGAAVAAEAASRGGGGGRGGYRSSNGRRATIASSPLDDERDERAVRHCCNTLIGDIPRLIACLLDAARAGPQLHAGPARGLLRTVPVHLSRALHLTTHHLTDRAERQRLVVSTYTGYGGGEGEDAVPPPPMGLPPLCMAVPAMLPLINAIARFMGDPDQGVRSVASQCCALVLRHIIRSDEASRSVADDDARGRIPFSPLIAVQDTAWSTMEQVFASSLVDTYLGLPADQYVFSSPQMAALPHGLAPMGGGMRGGMRGGMGAGGDMGGRGAQIPQQGRRIYHPSAAFAAMANVLRLVSPTSYWIDNDGRVSSTAGGSGENERERRPPSKIDGLFQSWTHILAHCGALWRWRVAAAEVSAAIGHGESGSRLVPRRMSSTIGAPGIGSGLGSSSGAAAAHEDRALSACVALAGLFWQHRRPWHTVSMLRDAAALHGRVGGNSWCSGNCLALEALVLLNEVDWASDVSKTIALACGALEGSVLCYQMAGAWGDAAAAARSLVLCTAAQEENEAREAAIDGGLSMVGADAMAAAEALSSQLLQSPRIGSLLEQADGLAMRAAEAARGGGAATASEKNHTQASHSKPQFEYYAVLLFGTGFGRPSTRGQPPTASASQHGGASEGGPYGDQPGDRSGAETSGRPPLQALPLVPGLDDDMGATNGSMFMYRREMSGADDSHYNGGGANADDALRRVVHRLGHKYAATEAAEASVAGGMYGGGGGYGGGDGGM